MNTEFKLRASKPQRNKHDAYFTPPECTRILLDHIPKTWTNNGGYKAVIGEPCAGDNWIADVLTATGNIKVLTADIDPSRPVIYREVDFLGSEATRIFGNVQAIISNPPYSHAAPIVRKALSLSPRVAMLLRMTFLEGCEDDPKSARLDLLKGLARVIILPRISFIHGSGGKQKTDSVPPAWFIWDPEHEGAPQITWISKLELEHARGQTQLWSQP